MALELKIDEALWLETEDLTKSGPDDRHFVLDRDSGQIHFGDGKHGAVPAPGATFELSVRTWSELGEILPSFYRLHVPDGGTVVIHTVISAWEQPDQGRERAKRLGCLTAIVGAIAGIFAWRSRR